MLTNRLPRMMAIAALLAACSATAGLYASYYFSVAAGSAIVLTCALLFGAAWLYHSVWQAGAAR